MDRSAIEGDNTQPGIVFRLLRWAVQFIRWAWLAILGLLALAILVAAFQIAWAGDWFVVVIAAVIGLFFWLAYRTKRRRDAYVQVRNRRRYDRT
jgi:hypothetical protein